MTGRLYSLNSFFIDKFTVLRYTKRLSGYLIDTSVNLYFFKTLPQLRSQSPINTFMRICMSVLQNSRYSPCLIENWLV
jgi:GR25 family glycosyltransferase involved in LPS biosynthesis